MQTAKQTWEVGQCRERTTSINHPSGPEFCYNCNHYTLLDYLRRCQCCNLRVIRRRTYIAEVKVFDRILSQNQALIEWCIKNHYDSETLPGFAIKIGYRTYLVSVKHLTKYYEMPNTRNPEKVAPFFINIKKTCLQLMPGTSVR